MNIAWTSPAVCALASASLALTSILPAQSVEPKTGPASPASAIDSIRYIDLPDGRAELQTSVISLKNETGTVVDLVSAVHIGDASYFEALNQLLAGYDVVLYELVGGPVEQREEQAPNAELNGTRLLQSVVKSMLGLRYQLDGIDYKRPNFVHADATWEDWERLNAEREQSMATLFARAMEMQNDPALKKEMEEMKTEEVFTQILSAVQEFNPDKFKRSLAPMLSEAEGFVTKLEGKDGTVIITERNKIVMESVKEQVAKGHRKIAVFYGAGHMPDLQTRLETEGFKPAGNTWMTAWNIGNSATSVTGLDLLENVLKDDSVVEGVISIFRTFAGENLLQPSN
ncbi:MAG: hypothetical protein DVB23_000516 [Verrucomicrobia bacterium]|jgi:hypothetical protein|nr:MAG: hypothetical protein DVB23_000516 [Verrucomicrobiota bacterium]